MRNISLDLSGKLDPNRERIFRDVIGAIAALRLPIFVVGACARDLLLDLYYGLPAARATRDIDFGIRVESWLVFEDAIEALVATGRYTADPERPQRLHSINGLFIDIVPFGGIEGSADRTIKWPPGNAVIMNACGFEEAYRDAITIRLAPGLEVLVSSLAGLALMKLVAWLDRRQMKDAKDLKMIMASYLQAGNWERLERGDEADLLNEENFTSAEMTSARLLGRDVASLLTQQHEVIMIGMSSRWDELAAGMAAGAIEIDEAFEAARQMLALFRQGILDRSGRE